MKKIIFIRSTHHPARFLKEAISLTNAGYIVEVLCWDRTTNISRTEMNNGVCMHYFGKKAPYGKLSLIFYLFFWWVYELNFLLMKNYDVMHVCGFDSLIPSALVKAVKRQKIIYDIFDFYAETLTPSIPKKIVSIIAKMEIFCIKFVDGVIIVDESRYVQVKDAKIKNMSIVMNCPSDLIPKDLNKPKNQEFTIFYGGMISKTRGLMQLYEAVKDMADVKLIIAGSGEDDSIFGPMFSDMQNAKYVGQVAYDDSIKFTLQADAVFAFYDPKIPNNRLASPNKLFEAMMCSTPLIGNEETTMKDIIEKYNCGITLPYDDSNTLRESILTLKNNPQMCFEMGESGRSAFESKYNWEIMEKRLFQLYTLI